MVEPRPDPRPRTTLAHGARPLERTHEERTLASQTQVGRYPVLGVLGSGGMGEVLHVRDPELNRDVALKLIRAEAMSERAVQKFVLEAQVTGQLQHPNIVPLHELGRDDAGRLYFTLKKVDGRTLEAMLADERAAGTRWSDGEARRIEIMIKICDALSYAHARGVIHRDLKPANAMVGAFGEVLVMDWGLAKLAGQPDLAAPGVVLDLRCVASQEVPLATLDGTLCGTPAYMAPEQAEGAMDRIDERTDVYALGAILYEMLTLEPPATGATAWAVVAKVVVGDIPPPRTRAPRRGIPAELEAVVVRAMALAPEDRYASVADLAADLRAYVDGRLLVAAHYSLGARLAKLARRRRGPLLAAAAVLAVAVAVGGAVVQRSRRERDLQVDRALAAADAAVAGQPDAAELRRAVAAFDASALASRSALDDHRAAWRSHLGAYLRQTSELDRALVLDSTRVGLVARRLTAGEALAMAALLAGEMVLSRQAYTDLARWGVDEEAIDGWGRHLEGVDTALVRWQQRNLTWMLADLELGLGDDARHFAAWGFDEYAHEAASYRDAATAAALGDALDALGRELATRPPSQVERVRVSFCCVVLGRLALPASVPPLARWSRLATDADQIVEVGLALCHTGRSEAYGVLVELRTRLDAASQDWQRISRAFKLVPEPTAPATDAAGLARFHVDRGLIRHDQGNHKGALQDYDEALRQVPNAALVWMYRGNTRKAQGDHARAIVDFDEAIRLAPELWLAYHNRSASRGQLGDSAGALEDIDVAIRLAPQFAASHQVRGDLLLRKRDFDGAERCYDRAIELDARIAEAHVQRASIRQRRGDLVGATSDFEAAFRIDPRNVLCLLNWSEVLRARGDGEGAYALVEKAIAIEPRCSDCFVQRGRLELDRQRLPAALAAYDQAVALHGDNANARVQRAYARSLAGDLTGARSDLDLVIEHSPTHAEAWRMRAELRHDARDLPGAMTDYDRSIELDAANAKTIQNRGHLRAELGDWAGAEADYDRAIGLNRRYAIAYANRASVRARREAFELARADFDRSIELEPTRGIFHGNRGAFRLDRGDAAGALGDLDRALQLEPAQWHFAIVRGKALAKLGRKDEALEALRRVQAEAPPALRARSAAVIAEIERER